ncbi:MAG: DNA cytosine methyltransferase [Desulfovibrio sp.]|nr:DNA cytosine methyltransferase [Desulfovibrio sp.]
MSKEREYKCIDCFCGAGGLALGLRRAGFSIVYSFDNDPKAIETIVSNPAYIPAHLSEVADAVSLDVPRMLEMLGLRPGETDLLAGGPPCQGFSIQRRGDDSDLRNNLVPRYFEIIRLIMPKMFVMENVPGIMGRRGREILRGCLERAAGFGYFVSERTLDAQEFGTPQRRKRIFVVGERKDHAGPLFKFPSGSSARVTVREAIGFLPPPPEDGTDHPGYRHHRRDRLSEDNLKRIRSLKEGQGRDFLPDDLLLPCHRVSSAKMGHRNVFGRMRWDSPAPTITARFDSFSRGMFGHPEQDRSVSLREGALLQSFPLDYNFAGSKVEIARQIGNAVPPRLAEALGTSLMEALKKWTS